MDIPNEVFNGCLNGNRKAQEKLYRFSFDFLMSIACRYMRNKDDALAMVNFGFYKILKELKRYDTNRSYEVWASRIITNVIIDQYRIDRKYREVLEDWARYEDLNITVTLNLFEKDIEEESLNQLLLSLPEMENKVFNLYVMDGYKHSEISEMLDIPVGTSRWYLSQARARLREMVNRNQEKKSLRAQNVGK